MITSIPSPFIVPAAPGDLYVILDASFDPELPAQLVELMGNRVKRYVSLFETTSYAGLQAAGPFAVLCSEHDPSMDFASALLERADAGCVACLDTEQSFDRAVEHWRSLLTVSTDKTPARLMRFFDPRWLEPLINSLDENELSQFMGPLTCLAWRNELGWRHLANLRPDLQAAIHAPGWLHLSFERLALMEQQRLKVLARRFALDYQSVLKMPDPAQFVYRQLQAAQQSGYLQPAEQERWLRLSLQRGDGFWDRSPHIEVLIRDDLSLREKLIQLERF